MLDVERVHKVTKKTFIIRLEYKQRFLRIDRFFATADGLVGMSAFIKECRELAACGMCPCPEDGGLRRVRRVLPQTVSHAARLAVTISTIRFVSG